MKLPSGSYEIPLVIQDRSFNADGSLYYPGEPYDPRLDGDPPVDLDPVTPSIVPEFFGDTILVNGKVWPYLKVKGENTACGSSMVRAPELTFSGLTMA